MMSPHGKPQLNKHVKPRYGSRRSNDLYTVQQDQSYLVTWLCSFFKLQRPHLPSVRSHISHQPELHLLCFVRKMVKYCAKGERGVLCSCFPEGQVNG